MWWMIPAAMAALGAAKGSSQAKRQQEVEDQTRKQRAAEIRYSPWTGMQSFTPIQHAGDSGGMILGGALQGFGGGALLGQSLGGGGSTPDAGSTMAIDASQGRMQDAALVQNPMLYGQPTGYQEMPTWAGMNRISGRNYLGA